MQTLCYYTYLIVGIIGTGIVTGAVDYIPTLPEALMAILMWLGILIFLYLGVVVLFSIVNFRERPLFLLGVLTIIEVAIQKGNSFWRDDTSVYYGVALPYFAVITVVSFTSLFLPRKRGHGD